MASGIAADCGDDGRLGRRAEAFIDARGPGVRDERARLHASALGHGLDHGPELAVAHDNLPETDRGWGNPLAMHVQALVTAELTDGGSVHRGMGVLEQLFVGPHEPTGLVGLMDPAP